MPFSFCLFLVKLPLASLPANRVKSEKNAVKSRDALHLACAETAVCDYFITCDDVLIKGLQRGRRVSELKVKAINPVEFMRSEGGLYGES